MDLNKYRALFVDEAADHLTEMSRALSALESDGSDTREAVDTLFRMTHSIKGMAASLDYLSVSTLAHKLEDWLEPMRREGRIPEGCLGLIYDVVQALEQMVAIVDGTGDAPPSRDDLLARLAEPVESTPRVPGVRDSTKKARASLRPRSREASG